MKMEKFAPPLLMCIFGGIVIDLFSMIATGMTLIILGAISFIALGIKSFAE